MELTKRLADGMDSPKMKGKKNNPGGGRHGLMNVIGGGIQQS